MLTQCKGVLVSRLEGSSDRAANESAGDLSESYCAGPGGVVNNGEDLNTDEVSEMITLLGKMIAMERTVWNRRLSTHLMSLCQVGNINSGARRTTPVVVASYNSVGAVSPRVCLGGHCKPRTDKSNYKSARTTGVCWCNVCSNDQGKARALHLCKQCKGIDAAHVAAAAAADRPAAPGRTRAAYKSVEWRNQFVPAL